MPGTLFLVATPIGNLGDITLRAIETLNAADVVAAEDTRRFRVLAERFSIKAKTIAYHEHNKADSGRGILALLQGGKNVAIVTDAGTPAICDPGFELVRLCAEAGVPVTVCPGANAAICALALSGVTPTPFVFYGFLPKKKKELDAALAEIAEERKTVVLYEAPHRLVKTLSALAAVAGNRQAAAVRELTKKFEQVKRGTAGELLAYYAESPPKGEFVLVIAGADKEKAPQNIKAFPDSVSEHVSMYEKQGLAHRDAMKAAAADRGEHKREVYKQLMDGKP
jgi:16S rRNA (cytidine1402-2'-O)-methyltransferase